MRRGITQEAFAEEIDISISYYQKLERGARSCSLDILVLIAEHLHVTTDYLLTGKKHRQTKSKQPSEPPLSCLRNWLQKYKTHYLCR